jgi:hypothetical protein
MLLALTAFGLSWNKLKAPEKGRSEILIEVSAQSYIEDVYEVHYDTTGTGFHRSMRCGDTLDASMRIEQINFRIPFSENLNALRLDLGSLPIEVVLHSIRIDGPHRSERIDASKILELFPFRNQVDSAVFNNRTGALSVFCNGSDPYLATEGNSISQLKAVLSARRPVLFPFLKSVGIGIGVLLLLLILLNIHWTKVILSLVRAIGAVDISPVLIIPFLLSVILGAAVFAFTSQIELEDRAIVVHVQGTFRVDDEAQIYYATQKGRFTSDHFVSAPIKGSPGKQIIEFTIPRDSSFNFLRFDPGSRQDTVLIDRLTLSCGEARYTYEPIDLEYEFDHNEQMEPLHRRNGRLEIVFRENDPFIFTDIDLSKRIKQLRANRPVGAMPWLFAIIAALFMWATISTRIKDWVTGSDTPPVDLAMAGVFLMLIFLPLTLGLLGMELQGANTEKRILAGKPTFLIRNASAYPQQYTDYFKDNFETRQLLFRWNSLFYTKVLNTSPRPDRVLLGKDDWMFLIQKHALDQYQELCNIEEKDLKLMAQNLQDRKDWLEKMGIPFVLIVPPQKATIYPELLPDNIHKVGDSKCLDLFRDYLLEHADVDLIDLREPLLALKSKHQVYYSTDIHWNTIGGHTGYLELMKYMRTKVPGLSPPIPLSDFEFLLDTNFHADLSMMLAINDVYPRVTPMFMNGAEKKAEDASKREYPNSAFFQFAPVIKQTPDTAAPRLLMFRDSFAVYMIPHLSEHFSRSVYIWSPVFIPEIVLVEKPDVVVQEMMEVFIHRITEDDLRLPEIATDQVAN